MPEFLLEFYTSRVDDAAVMQDAERARLGAEELSREGRPVRYVRSIFVPEDETCLFLYEAGTAEDVRLAATRGAVRFARVTELFDIGSSTGGAR